jgi:hypothetical protein
MGGGACPTYSMFSYHSQILDGVTTAGNGTSHFSTGNASTP